MFTGIVENQGSVVRLMRRGGGARLEVRAPEIVPELQIGDSVAVNGACVTVTEKNSEAFACDLVPETVARTNLGILDVGEEVNLERPVRAADRLGGHIVQGHVDAVGLVRSRRRVGAQEVLEVTVPFELTRYLAPQGSVSLDGVSLTVVAVDRDRFRVALIPHTVAVTTLGRKGQGASVNVEVDVISKYVERHMAARAPKQTFTIFEEQPKERTEPPRAPAPKPAQARPVTHTPPVSPARAKPRPAPKTAPKKVAKRPTATVNRTKRSAAKPAKRRR
jgi:riboflavin synthase